MRVEVAFEDEDEEDEVVEDDEDVEVGTWRVLRRMRLLAGCPSIGGDSWECSVVLDFIVA